MGFNDLRKKAGTSQAVDGSTTTTITGPLTAFGDVQVASLTPVAQGDFVYSINEKIFSPRGFAGGTVTQSEGMAEITSGTNSVGSATVQTRRGLKYRPGQGSLMRATALFDTPDAGNAQFIGCGNSECGYFIGYFGEFFGILHNSKALRHIVALQITLAAGTEDIDIELNGYTTRISVVGGGNIPQTAYEISKGDFSQVADGGWLTDVIEDTVYFISSRAIAVTGNFSITPVGAGTVSGTFQPTIQTGTPATPQTQQFYPQSTFNIDKLDGTGPSGMILNPQTGNVYEIGFQYLGFGNARFGIEDPTTGRLFDFHMINNANNRTSPVLKNPNVSILATSANIGGTTSTTLRTASMAGYVQGQIVNLDPTFAKTFSITTNSTSYVPAAIFKVNRVFNDQSCFGEFDLLQLAVGNGTSTLTVGVFISEELQNENVNFVNLEEGSSIVSYALGTSSGVFGSWTPSTNPIYEMTIGTNAARTEVFNPNRFVISAGEHLVIAVKTGGGSTNGRISLNWFEQQ